MEFSARYVGGWGRRSILNTRNGKNIQHSSWLTAIDGHGNFINCRAASHSNGHVPLHPQTAKAAQSRAPSHKSNFPRMPTLQQTAAQSSSGSTRRRSRSRSRTRCAQPLWKTTMNMISVLLVVAVVMGTAAGEAPMEYKEMTLINQCNFPVWPVVTGGSDGRAAPSGALAPRGGRRSWLAGAFWSGTVWGRTGCHVQTQTIGRQQRRRLACDSGVRTASGALFATTASFEFLGGVAKPDTMYVSVEQGFNLPMEVVPAPKCGGPASAMGCAALAQQVCPARRFQIRKGNNVTACAARFPRHDDDSAGGGAGAGAGMATTFRKACPSAFPFRTAVLCPPSTASYRLVFCPASRRSHPRHP